MSASTVVKALYDGSITVADGTGSPVTLVVPFTVGDLSLDGLMESQRAIQAYQTRGSLNSVRLAAREFPSVSFSAQLADISDAADTTLIDFCLKQGSYNANVSTLTGSDVYAIKVTLTVEGTDVGDSNDHTIVMDDVHVTVAIAEGEPDSVTISGTVYGAVTMT
tara:strand:- start:2272 stop:2763 length:492 start_codon:yes stop_codon:yes gene_type:complete